VKLIKYNVRADFLSDCTPIPTTTGRRASQIPLWVEPDDVEAQNER